MKSIALISLLFLFGLSCSAPSGSNNATHAPAAGADAAETSPTRSAGPGNSAAAGHYRMVGPPDEASQLLLSPDGRFQYMLAAGALDARAEGRWTSDGRAVTLNTEPRPMPPAFSAGPVTRGGDEPLVIRVTSPEGRGLAGIDLRVGFADGSTLEGYTQEYGWSPPGGEKPGVPRWVELALPMYGVAPRRFPLAPSAGNAFAFILTPNDLGVVDFRDARLDVTERGLIMRERGISYVREGK